MANKLQKLLYNMSTFSPYFLAWNIWDWWQNKALTDITMYSIYINGILCIWFYIFFMASCERKLPKEKVSVESCTPTGMKLIDFIQLIPFVVTFFSLPFGLLLYVILVIVITWGNINIVSPLLFSIKSNLYEIKPKEGIDGYLLATDKEISNNEQIVEVKKVFKYFLID